MDEPTDKPVPEILGYAPPPGRRTANQWTWLIFPWFLIVYGVGFLTVAAIGLLRPALWVEIGSVTVECVYIVVGLGLCAAGAWVHRITAWRRER